MSTPRISGLKEPLNLTGQVIVDKNENEGTFWGHYSCVYLGRYRNELVAVKIIQRSGKPESMKRKVDRERIVWATVNHPNILPFYGFADDEGFAPFGALVSPWCAKGDAGRYLSEHGETMPLSDRIKLWKGVIQGVIYLHDHKPILVHGDLKPGNILIDALGMPKICDFGLTRIFLEEGHTDMTTTSEHTGTARYLAPELASNDAAVYPTTSSDVYALGCLGLEFIHLQKPYANRVNNLRGQIYVDLRKGLPPVTQEPHGAWPSCHVWPLISQMWDIDPICRPVAFIAGRTLDSILFTLPQTIVQRIVFCSASILGSKGEEVDTQEWQCRCDLLRTLCLVSRACKECTLPFLYGKIRLYLRLGGSSLTGLIKTFNHSNEYGKHVKTFILITPSFYLDPWCGTSSPDVRHLLQMMPSLRYAVISTLEMFPFTSPIRSVASLEIRGSYASQILGEECTLEVLAVVKRLSLIGGEPLPIGAFEPSFKPNVLATHPFPNLQVIDVQGDSQLLLDWVKTLERISGWSLPRLISVEFNMHHSEDFGVERAFNPGRDKVITTFLWVHRHTIQYLTLNAARYADDSVLPWVLPACPKLRSLVISTPKLILPEEIPRHPNLEMIIIWVGVCSNSASSTLTLNVAQIKRFRGLSLTFLPQLKTAEFNWSVKSGDGDTTKVSASFKMGVDDIAINGIARGWSFSPWLALT